ncbi:MAG: hypothetical protein WBA93_21555 [Microcoleaceae cyanobacterium]
MVTLNLIGGWIYDALITQVVFKAEVYRLLTLNPNYFIRLGEEIVRAPSFRVRSMKCNAPY